MLREKILLPPGSAHLLGGGRCRSFVPDEGGALGPRWSGSAGQSWGAVRLLYTPSPFRHSEFFLPAMLKYTKCLMLHPWDTAERRRSSSVCQNYPLKNGHVPPWAPCAGFSRGASQAAAGRFLTRDCRGIGAAVSICDCKVPSLETVFLMKAPMQHCVQYGIVPTQTVHYEYVKSSHLERNAVFQPCLPLHFSGLLLVGLIKLAIIILPESWLSSPFK